MRSLMYKKQKVPTLSHKSLLTLGNTIVRSFYFAKENRADSNAALYSKEIAPHKIKEYLKNSNATSRVYRDLFKKILECDISSEVFFLAMEAIFNESIKFIGKKPFGTLEENTRYWDMLLKHPGGFQKLQFDYVRLNESSLAKILEKSPNLKELELDARNLTSISLLPQTLTKINIRGIKSSEVANILLSCPNIESLCSFGEVGESLMICLKKNKNFRSKLKHVSQDNANKNIFEAIVLTCPQMNSLHLDIIEDESLFVLNQTVLSELKITSWFRTNDFMPLLAKIGCNLRHLEISFRIDIDLGKLSKYCPSLHILRVKHTRFYMSHTVATFDYLKKLEILCDPISISELDFKTLLNNLKSLESFEAFKVPFNDDDIQSIFGGRDFVNLTKFFVFSSERLTAQSVHILLECCPKLEFIAALDNWNIPKNEIDLNFKCLKNVRDWQFTSLLNYTHNFQ